MKTFDQCKDEVAKNNNHTSFEDYLSKISRSKHAFKYIDSLLTEAAELYAQEVAKDALKWISVKEKLPDKGFEYYLVWNTANQEGSERQIQAFINCFTSKVTHWMPLPKSPYQPNQEKP